MTTLPLPEPPADDVAQVLDDLRRSRRELDDAGRVVALLGMEPDEGSPDGFSWRRLVIERQAAERRAELWAAEVRRVESAARRLGLDVTATR